MQPGPVHESLKPLGFLIGKWRSVSARGHYPTVEPFTYCEELEFASAGQPMLNYSSRTWHPVGKHPMHLESGFLRIKPGTDRVSFLVAHNFGLTSLEEGRVAGKEVRLKSSEISRMSFAKEPKVIEIARCFKYDEDGAKLECTVSMATNRTALTEHLSVIYEKCDVSELQN